jgi:hypothetical protein
MAMPSSHGVTNMDQTLKDYITRTMAKLTVENQTSATNFSSVNENNNYPVYPEEDGYDTPKNPYSPV